MEVHCETILSKEYAMDGTDSYHSCRLSGTTLVAREAAQDETISLCRSTGAPGSGCSAAVELRALDAQAAGA